MPVTQLDRLMSIQPPEASSSDAPARNEAHGPPSARQLAEFLHRESRSCCAMVCRLLRNSSSGRTVDQPRPAALDGTRSASVRPLLRERSMSSSGTEHIAASPATASSYFSCFAKLWISPLVQAAGLLEQGDQPLGVLEVARSGSFALDILGIPASNLRISSCLSGRAQASSRARTASVARTAGRGKAAAACRAAGRASRPGFHRPRRAAPCRIADVGERGAGVTGQLCASLRDCRGPPAHR